MTLWSHIGLKYLTTSVYHPQTTDKGKQYRKNIVTSLLQCVNDHQSVEICLSNLKPTGKIRKYIGAPATQHLAWYVQNILQDRRSSTIPWSYQQRHILKENLKLSANSYWFEYAQYSWKLQLAWNRRKPDITETNTLMFVNFQRSDLVKSCTQINLHRHLAIWRHWEVELGQL